MDNEASMLGFLWGENDSSSWSCGVWRSEFQAHVRKLYYDEAKTSVAFACILAKLEEIRLQKIQ